jgi:hypothetical protein|tara:strand:- start:515 stop:709 length:195 start_codon:yes stop_codon:yes gene_type:complete
MENKDIEFNKAQRQAWLRAQNIDFFMEALLEQMNSMRMKGTNLVQDMDGLVNAYLKVCKKYPIK